MEWCLAREKKIALIFFLTSMFIPIRECKYFHSRCLLSLLKYTPAFSWLHSFSRYFVHCFWAPCKYLMREIVYLLHVSVHFRNGFIIMKVQAEKFSYFILITQVNCCNNIKLILILSLQKHHDSHSNNGIKIQSTTSHNISGQTTIYLVW